MLFRPRRWGYRGLSMPPPPKKKTTQKKKEKKEEGAKTEHGCTEWGLVGSGEYGQAKKRAGCAYHHGAKVPSARPAREGACHHGAKGLVAGMGQNGV